MSLFRERNNTVIKVWLGEEGDEPFICAANGEFTVEVLAEMEAALIEDEHEFSSGAGEYTYIAQYDDGQYDEMGRCEFPPYWDFIELSFTRPAWMTASEDRAERIATNPGEACEDCGDPACHFKHNCQLPF